MAKKRVRRILSSCEIRPLRTTLKPGDDVMLRPPKGNVPPYIARVEAIEADVSDRVTLTCRWYYRPEESSGGRRSFHGDKEVFLSDHLDKCSADSVEKKCTVHTLENYVKLKSVTPSDFFRRFEYNASSGGFTPDRVTV
eukprot:jgi/Mesen1/11013/ME000098S10411